MRRLEKERYDTAESNGNYRVVTVDRFKIEGVSRFVKLFTTRLRSGLGLNR
jgi:hypothetical protein